MAALTLAMLIGCETEAPPSGATGSLSPTQPSPGASATIVPIASPEPTDTALPEWQFDRIPFVGMASDAAGGPTGLVAVGICESDDRSADLMGCDQDAPGDYYPSVLGSVYGRLWQQGSVTDGRDAEMRDVVWTGSYLAAGLRCTPAPNLRRCYEAGIWRSEDGLDWSRISSFSFGKGRNTGPDRQYVGSLAASASGALVLGWVHRIDEPGVSGIYASPDGTSWSRVSSAQFGPDWHFGHWRNPYDVVGTDTGFAILGTGCAGCPFRSYLSEDGATWRFAGEAQIDPDVRQIDLATDGRQFVAAVVRRDAADEWTEVWSSSNGGTWTREQVVPGLGNPELAYVGDRFVLVGVFGRLPDWRYVARLSPDGQSWTDMRPVFRASSTAEPELACVQFVGGGSDGILLGGECGVWHAALP